MNIKYANLSLFVLLIPALSMCGLNGYKASAPTLDQVNQQLREQRADKEAPSKLAQFGLGAGGICLYGFAGALFGSFLKDSHNFNANQPLLANDGYKKCESFSPYGWGGLIGALFGIGIKLDSDSMSDSSPSFFNWTNAGRLTVPVLCALFIIFSK